MYRRKLFLVLGSFLLAGPFHTAVGLAQTPGTQATDTKAVFLKDIQPFLAKHCTNCHGGPKPKGGLSLVFKDERDAGKSRLVWERVVAALRAGEMPPSGRPKPAAKEQEHVLAAIDSALLNIKCDGPRDPGRVTIRRLNKTEYNNTIRDLLHIKDATFRPADDFPSDDVGYGFDNIGDVLTLSPLLMERFLAAAEKAVETAFKSKESREKLLAPGKEKKSKFEQAEAVVREFMFRAYRRTAEPGEVASVLKFVQRAQEKGLDQEKGIQFAFQAVLCSPHFLFRVEVDRNNPKKEPGLVAPISEFELASRLSYFLWSSMPDDELLGQAKAGTLRKNLEPQVRRMLQSPKAYALAENFGGQWLNLRNLHIATPDPRLFRTFNTKLRLAMQEETERFFDHIVKEDRSILEFLDADYTFVNEVLAKHYGIPNVTGEQFQKVKLESGQRGGVITMASVLTITSNPNRTSPVKRGKWILENILNAPPPPPAPDAGELPEDDKQLTGTLRQRMEQHRAKPQCATCHRSMDPLGFALENYDAVGAWRQKDGKFDIDASGELPGGQKFTGAKELKKILLQKAPEFRRCLADKMLTYALGRGLEYYDKCALDDICAALEKNQNRFSALVLAIVKSEPFQLRKGRGFKN